MCREPDPSLANSSLLPLDAALSADEESEGTKEVSSKFSAVLAPTKALPCRHGANGSWCEMSSPEGGVTAQEKSCPLSLSHLPLTFSSIPEAAALQQAPAGLFICVLSAVNLSSSDLSKYLVLSIQRAEEVY